MAGTIELERPLLGYPDTTVSLHWDGVDFEVVIESPVGVVHWTPETGEDAISMYYHPFYHGYEWRQREDEIDQ